MQRFSCAPAGGGGGQEHHDPAAAGGPGEGSRVGAASWTALPDLREDAVAPGCKSVPVVASPRRVVSGELALVGGRRARAVRSPLGTLAPWHLGILAPWHLGTLAPWHLGTLAPWHQPFGTIRHRTHPLGTMEPAAIMNGQPRMIAVCQMRQAVRSPPAALQLGCRIGAGRPGRSTRLSGAADAVDTRLRTARWRASRWRW